MLGTVIDVFKGFFSRSFWFGNFLPVAIFAFLHLIIAWWVLPNVPLAEWASADPKSLTYFPIVFVVLVVIAYALIPIIPLVRGLLDGSLLPEAVQDMLRRGHVVAARAIQRRINDAVDRLNRAGTLKSRKLPLIWSARRSGNARLDAGNAAIGDASSIDALQRALRPLQTSYDGGEPLNAHALSAAADLLVTALNRNATEVPDNYNGLDRPVVARLDCLQSKLVQLLQAAEVDADHRLQSLLTLHRRTSYDNPQATRMADTRFLVEKYTSDAYDVDFDYIWPRLQMVIPSKGDDNDGASFASRLAAARDQIDFAVLCLALSLTIPAVWLPYLAYNSVSPMKFLVIGAIAPLLMIFFYHVAVESQAAFGEAMKAAIDNYRLDLLSKNLRQGLPATLAEERELWSQLQAIDRARDRNLIYRHPKPQS
jgi:hypothetical protein